MDKERRDGEMECEMKWYRYLAGALCSLAVFAVMCYVLFMIAYSFLYWIVVSVIWDLA